MCLSRVRRGCRKKCPLLVRGTKPTVKKCQSSTCFRGPGHYTYLLKVFPQFPPTWNDSRFAKPGKLFASGLGEYTHPVIHKFVSKYERERAIRTLLFSPSFNRVMLCVCLHTWCGPGGEVWKERRFFTLLSQVPWCRTGTRNLPGISKRCDLMCVCVCGLDAWANLKCLSICAGGGGLGWGETLCFRNFHKSRWPDGALPWPGQGRCRGLFWCEFDLLFKFCWQAAPLRGVRGCCVTSSVGKRLVPVTGSLGM